LTGSHEIRSYLDRLPTTRRQSSGERGRGARPPGGYVPRWQQRSGWIAQTGYSPSVLGESAVISETARPATPRTIAEDLSALGLADGAVVIVHSAMSRLGWIAGGAQSVVEALLDVVGSTGTIVMPTQSGQLSDPAEWSNPPIPPDWVEIVRDGLPGYDRHLTPTRGMGQVVECFRQHPDTKRSGHPLVSFAANGPLADFVVEPHPLARGTGESSPLNRLYESDAEVLLLGVDHSSSTSLHLAEERATWRGKSMKMQGAPLIVESERRWITYEDLDIDDSDFARIGEDFAEAGHESTGGIAAGRGRLFSQPAVVDFAVDWMNAHRPESLDVADPTTACSDWRSR